MSIPSFSPFLSLNQYNLWFWSLQYIDACWGHLLLLIKPQTIMKNKQKAINSSRLWEYLRGKKEFSGNCPWPGSLIEWNFITLYLISCFMLQAAAGDNCSCGVVLTSSFGGLVLHLNILCGQQPCKSWLFGLARKNVIKNRFFLTVRLSLRAWADFSQVRSPMIWVAVRIWL